MPPSHHFSKYCDYKANQYYSFQGDFCKDCDKCITGWGKVNYQDSKFIIHPVHGAEGCLHCVRCGNGTYSESFSYEQCKPCTDCRQEGRYVEQECSSFQNAICGKSIPKTTSALSNGLTTSEIKLIAGLSSAFLGSLIIIALLCVFFRCRRKAGKEEKSKTEDGDINLALISNTTLSTNTTACSSDVETDGSEISDTKTTTVPAKVREWMSAHNIIEEFTCKHADMISKDIAENNYFHHIAIKMGISDADIKIIKIDYKSSVREQAYETLIKWIHQRGSEATVIKFLEILLELELYKIAEIFCVRYDTEEKKIPKN